MTRASSARRERRQRGRPKKDPCTDPDQVTITLVAAMRNAWGLSERRAFDLAICLLESWEGPATKVPRGSRHLTGILAGYDGPRFSGRSSSLRQKSKRTPPRRHVVQALSLASRCKDTLAVRRLFDQLVGLASVAGHERLQQVIERLVER
jgi:hypothetical protein